MRESWPKPPLSVLIRALRREDRESRRRRARRSQLVLAEFGPPTDMLLPGIPAMFALEEMKSSFVAGNYMAVVLIAQVFAEHALGHAFILSGDDSIAIGGFAKLIDESAGRNWISQELKSSLHALRKMRNPYTHTAVGLSSRGYMARLRDSGTWNPHRLSRRDALEALRTVVDLIRENSPGWRASGEQSEPPWWTDLNQHEPATRRPGVLETIYGNMSPDSSNWSMTDFDLFTRARFWARNGWMAVLVAFVAGLAVGFAGIAIFSQL